MKLRFHDKQFLYFSEFEINLIYNSIASTFSFDAVNSILDYPLIYSFVELFNDDEKLLLTGYILSSGYKISAKPELETYPGYSITGCLEDCSVPFPLQSDNLSLNQIASKLFKPFGVKYLVDPVVSADMDKTYEKSVASDGQTIKDYLTELCVQRNVIMTHTADGKVLFTRISIEKLKPVQFFNDDGKVGGLDISLTANGQAMHSHITVVRQASKDNPEASEYTILNPYVTNRFRPIIKILSSGDIYDLNKYARAALGQELLGIEVQIQTKEFVLPGNLIQIKSDRLKLRKPTNFFVTETTIKGTTKGEKYTLKCVLPDVYSNNKVKNIFL